MRASKATTARSSKGCRRGRAGVGMCPMIRAADQLSADLPRTIARRLRGVATLRKSPATCVVVPSAHTELVDKVSAAGVPFCAPCETTQATSGLDRYGLLHLPAAVCLGAPIGDGGGSRALSRAIDAGRDALVVINADAIATRESRETIVKALEHVARTAGKTLLNVERFGEQVLPADGAFSLLRQTKAQIALAPAAPKWSTPLSGRP